MRAILLGLWLMVLGLPSWAEAPKVVVDIAPVHALVAMVMGDVGTPVLLLPQGADAHDFQLRPSQAGDLDAADAVIWMGPDMSPWLERSLRGLGRDGGLALLDAPQTVTRPFADQDGDAHDHSHGAVDPHAWLNPENAQVWVGLIADVLAKADPAQASVYRANADAARLEVMRIEAEVTARLASVATKPFVVMHDAYGYFAGHFGLNVVGSLRNGDAALPGAAHLAALQNKVLTSGAVCLFPEANHNDSSAQQMAQATGLRLGAALDPEGSTLTPGADLYGALMMELAQGLADCLSVQ